MIGSMSARLDELPCFCEDEGQEEIGEDEVHTLAVAATAYALRCHARARTDWRIYTTMDLHYHPREPAAYVSPDVMICQPLQRDGWLESYRIGRQGPAPLLVVEVLSRRSAQQQDLTNKPELYGRLGVQEYLLLDPTGDFLPEQLRLLQYEPDGTWHTLRDQGGNGVASRFDFHVVVEPSGLPRFLNADRQPYRHPSEAEPTIEALQRDLDAARQHASDLQRQLDELRPGPTPPAENDR